ncbi:MAG TPA: cytochrome c, partial [Roseiflexaceae bacterium]|nr:cytochrome c [Roseiflexaceae bacterium]
MARRQPQHRPLNQRTLVIGGLLVGITLIIGVSLFSRTPDAGRIDAADSQLVADGRIVYRAYCASCHGADLEGQPNWQQPNPDGSMPAPPHDVSGHTWHHNDATLFAITKYGGADPPPP